MIIRTLKARRRSAFNSRAVPVEPGGAARAPIPAFLLCAMPRLSPPRLYSTCAEAVLELRGQCRQPMARSGQWHSPPAAGPSIGVRLAAPAGNRSRPESGRLAGMGMIAVWGPVTSFAATPDGCATMSSSSFSDAWSLAAGVIQGHGEPKFGSCILEMFAAVIRLKDLRKMPNQWILRRSPSLLPSIKAGSRPVKGVWFAGPSARLLIVERPNRPLAGLAVIRGHSVHASPTDASATLGLNHKSRSAIRPRRRAPSAALLPRSSSMLRTWCKHAPIDAPWRSDGRFTTQDAQDRS